MYLRRNFSAGALAGGALSFLPAGLRAADPDDWGAFCHRYVTDVGRIVDTGNGDISHSEGQGYGMLFAQTFGDRPLFERIWGWTQAALRRSTDPLHIWKWQPETPHIADANTATDGDLLIAWALLQAGQAWSEPTYTQQAHAILNALVRLATQRTDNGMILLPGVSGFQHAHCVVVNLSYYIFPALQAASDLDPGGVWSTILRDGAALIKRSSFGRYHLPPDWLAVPYSGTRLRIASGWPPRFSFDAIRIPLYMAWGRVLGDPLRTAFDSFWAHWGLDALPGWVDLTTGERSSYNAPPGFRAVAIASDNATWGHVPIPSVRDSRDYYSAALTLLARIASWEQKP